MMRNGAASTTLLKLAGALCTCAGLCWSSISPAAAHDQIDFVVERADLLAALRQLPERQRAVVVARYYYDLSYDEIAKAFAIRTGTVGATLSQALAKLRAAHAARQLVRGAMRS